MDILETFLGVTTSNNELDIYLHILGKENMGFATWGK
jgi:hypothetical protein